MARTIVRTDNAPKPVATYSQGIACNGMVYVAGQGPASPKSGKIETDEIKEQTRQTLENLKAIVEAAGSSMSKVVKVSVFLKDIGEFAQMNEVYRQFFPADPPVRTTVQVGTFPGRMKIEIDCIAEA